jgi:hypothetical protein
MRVTLGQREEQSRLNGVQYFVDCSVVFSEEEKAIIAVRGLQDEYFSVPPALPPTTRTAIYGLGAAHFIARIAWVAGCVLGLINIFANSMGNLPSMLLYVGIPADAFFW